MRKKWTDEEIQFLKFAYPKKDFDVKEASKELNRSVPAVQSKANKLGLFVYEEILPNGSKRCYKCKTILPLDCFYFLKAINKHASYCKECELERIRKKRLFKEGNDVGQGNNVVQGNDVGQNMIYEKKCSKCGEVKSINCFYKSKRHKKDGYNNICKTCKDEIANKSKLKRLKERGW